MINPEDLSPEDKKLLLIKFCECCSWAHECWLFHRSLFDKNKEKEATIGKIKYFSSKLSVITQEYSLLQISKLHDQVSINNQLNVTVDSVFRAYDWGERRSDIAKLRDQLLGLWTNIKTARHKVLAHNDFETLKNDDLHGTFTADLDRKYFIALQSFIDTAHDFVIGGPYPFGHHTETDVFEFLKILRKA